MGLGARTGKYPTFFLSFFLFLDDVFLSPSKRGFTLILFTCLGLVGILRDLGSA